MSVMTHACRALELAVDTKLLKLQHMQNKLLRSTSKFLSGGGGVTDPVFACRFQNFVHV